MSWSDLSWTAVLARLAALLAVASLVLRGGE